MLYIVAANYLFIIVIGNADFNPGPFSVSFPAQMTTSSFSVPITDDSMFEGNETFTVTIVPSTLPSRVVPGADCVVTVTIDDDDSKFSNNQ